MASQEAAAAPWAAGGRRGRGGSVRRWRPCRWNAATRGARRPSRDVTRAGMRRDVGRAGAQAPARRNAAAED